MTLTDTSCRPYSTRPAQSNRPAVPSRPGVAVAVATTTHFNRWPEVESYWNITQEGETPTRTFQGSFPSRGLACWDWVTLDRCAGANFEADGWVHQDINGDLLPTAYGAQFDGSCLVALGDPGFVFTMDPKGYAPCGALSSEQQIDLRRQRCDGTVGSATWDAAEVADDKTAELAAVKLRVHDAATGELLAAKDLTNGRLDLSGIDAAAHPALRVSVAVLSSPGADAWADAIPPRLVVRWHADPAQLCFRTTTTAACQVAPISVTAGGATRQLTLTPVGCPTPTPVATPTPTPVPEPKLPDSTDLVLGCSDRRVVLEDVFLSGSRVTLPGLADRRFAGRTVQLVFAATGKVVATAKVGANGHFSATAPAPPKPLRNSNKARYLARIGTETSLNLKLARRILVTRVRAAGGKVTIDGRVVGPLAAKAPDRVITLQRVVACHAVETVTRFSPRKNGSFSVTVAAPAGQRAAVYRLQTKVRRTAGAKKPTNTFTLPRAVDFF